MSNITLLASQRIKHLPDDLPDKLRELAVAIEKGEVTSLLCAFTQNDHYCFISPSSLQDTLVLAALLQRKSVDAFIV